MFSEIVSLMSELPEPDVDDRVIHDTLLDADQLAFDVMLILFVMDAEVTDIFDGEIVGTSTLSPFCVTVISLLSEPEERPVSDTVTVPVRFVVLVLAEVLTVIVLPLVVTVIQLSLFDVANVPSVETLTVFDPPAALKERFSGETVKYLPSCVIETVAEPALFLIVTEPVREAVVLFSVTDILILELPVPEADDRVIQEASFVAVQLAFVAIEIVFVAAADETEMLEGETVGASTLAPF